MALEAKCKKPSNELAIVPCKEDNMLIIISYLCSASGVHGGT